LHYGKERQARKVCEINISDLIGVLLNVIVSLIAGGWYFIRHYYFFDCGDLIDLIGIVLDTIISLVYFFLARRPIQRF
jgi:hypothetical protein